VKKIKSSFIVIVATILSGCSAMDTIPGGSFNKLDLETLAFLNDAPRIDLERYGRQSERDKNHQKLTDTAIMVAASGGGQRAAAFTMGVLYELQYLLADQNNERLNVLNEVDYFSTVSGGGWATGAYLTNMLQHKTNNPDVPYTLDRNKLDNIKSGIRKLEMGLGSTCLVEKVDRNFTSIDGKSVTFGSIFVSRGESPKVPYLFSNATIDSNHSPFVFTDAYVEKYHVNSFSYCGKIGFSNGEVTKSFSSSSINGDISKLPISVAIGASSSVPGFRHTKVKTDMCNNQGYDGTFICRHGLDNMSLFDGGVYDNLGYKTGLEILANSPEKKKVLIVIDANADTLLPLDKERDSDLGISLRAAKMSTLSANAETARKYLEFVADSMGIKVVVLKFSDVAGIVGKQNKLIEKTSIDPLDGLCKLIEVASEEIECDIEKECLENKFYRTGLWSKTSHKIGPNAYDAVQDLGRLVVRVRSSDIRQRIGW